MLCLSTRICHRPQGGSRSCQGGCPAPCVGRGGEEPGCSAAMSELMPPAAPGRRSPEPPPPCRLVGDGGSCTTHGLAVAKHPQATHGEAPWEPAAAIARTAALDSCAGKPLPWGTPTFYPTGSILVRATQDLEVSPHRCTPPHSLLRSSPHTKKPQTSDAEFWATLFMERVTFSKRGLIKAVGCRDWQVGSLVGERD